MGRRPAEFRSPAAAPGPPRDPRRPGGPPTSYVAFDVLALDGQDQRGLTYAARRARLERLSAGWVPPLEICPSTADRDEATAWCTDYRPAGIEGLVIKSANGRYPTGRRDWIKVKNRQTREVIVGAVIGSIRRPESVIAAALIDGELARRRPHGRAHIRPGNGLGEALDAGRRRSPLAG